MEASKQLSRFSTREQKPRSQSTPIQGQKIEKKNKKQGSTLSKIRLSSTILSKRINPTIQPTLGFLNMRKEAKNRKYANSRAIERKKQEARKHSVRNPVVINNTKEDNQWKHPNNSPVLQDENIN